MIRKIIIGVFITFAALSISSCSSKEEHGHEHSECCVKHGEHECCKGEAENKECIKGGEDKCCKGKEHAECSKDTKKCCSKDGHKHSADCNHSKDDAHDHSHNHDGEESHSHDHGHLDGNQENHAHSHIEVVNDEVGL